MRGPLDGRVALVTGGAGGIGRASARRLAEAGAFVAINDLDAEGAAEVAASLITDGFTARAHGGDVADPSQVEGLVSEVSEAFGPIDILHSNAGFIRYASALEHTLSDWERTFAVNVRAGFLLARATLPAMLARERGVQIFTSSTSGHAGDPQLPAYSASKAALMNLVRQLSTDYSGRGVRFVAVNPGWIDTGFDAEGLVDLGPAGVDQMIRDTVPMQRWGRPEEVAAAVAWLASDEASYITGTSLDVDGGGRGQG